MKQQLGVTALLITIIMLPMIPVTADNPDIDYTNGNTVFTYSGGATTVELIGEWDWDNPVTLAENSGVWTTEVALEEGIYCYKLIIDGEYNFDPINPYRGYCGNVENSVVRVKDSLRPNFASELINDQLIITFLPGTSGAGPAGTPTGLETATWDSLSMAWTLDTTTLSDGKHTLKLELNDTDGNQAYDQLVPFWVGQQSEFSWDDSLIYMVMTDRFVNGNSSNDGQPTGAAPGADWMGGDFEGVTAKIQSGYFANLGVNALWLTPFNTNAQGTGIAADGVHDVSAFHGYWPIAAREVDPRLGTAQQLKAMVDAAHNAGIRVMMDYVVNHVHQDHTYYQENPEWFNQGCICGTENCDWTEHRLDCQFTSYMPDVNWKIREASEQFIEDALWWLEEFDLDGARIDAVKHVDDLAATNLATRINERFETVGTDYYLKGETAMGWSGDNLADNQYQYDTINRYIGENSLDGQADFVLYHAVVDNVFTQGIRNYQHLDYWTARSQDQYVPGAVMVPYVGSHDVPRLASRSDRGTGDANNQWQEQGLPGQPGTDETYHRIWQAYGWLLTTPGAPLLYYGDEYGEYGGADPDNRHMYRESGDWNERESALFDKISALGRLRAESIAIKQGAYTTRYASPDLLIYDMSHPEQNMSIILNRGSATTYEGFSNTDLVRFGDTVITSSTTSIPANSVSVIELDVVTEPPPREQDSECLTVNNFTINATYFITLDLTNTCDKEIHYPGVNSSVNNALVEGFPDNTEWFYLIDPYTSYNMTWQLSINETIPNGSTIMLNFAAAILNCSDDEESTQPHYCPTSTLSHTFIINRPTNSSNDSNDSNGTSTVLGCTDSTATNFDVAATEDDGSCEYPLPAVTGCTDSSATNFDAAATEDDGSCVYSSPAVPGCTDSTALNFNATANQDDGTCQYTTDLSTNNSTNNQTTDINQNNTDRVEDNEENNLASDVDNSSQNNGTNTVKDTEIITDAEEKSSLREFVRNGLAVAVFCSLIILLFTTIRKR